MSNKSSGIFHPHTKAFKDLIIVITFTIIVIVLASLFDASGVLFSFLEHRNETLLDEIGFAVITLVFGLSFFSLRRWRESKRELTARMQAEQTSRISGASETIRH